MVKIECTVTYNDLQLERQIKIGEQITVTNERADYLVNTKGYAKVIEVIPEEEKPEEVKSLPKKPEPKKKKNKT
jgi:hypothetical protein